MKKYLDQYKKKIIIFCPSIEEGGVEKNLFILSNKFAEKKIEVHVVTANFDKKKEFNSNVNFHSPATNFWSKKPRIIKSLICSLIIIKKFYKKNINIISFQSNIFAIILSKIIRCKVTIRSNTSTQQYIKFSLKNLFFRYFFKMANNVIVNSKEFKKIIDKQFNIKSILIYNPIFSPNNKIKNLKYPSIFSKNVKVKILNIGRLTKQKDQLTIAKAIKFYVERFNKNISVRIIGKGTEKKTIQNYINKNKLQKYIKLVGYLKNAEQYIHQCDIFVLSSIAEGLPNVLIEALNKKKIKV